MPIISAINSIQTRDTQAENAARTLATQHEARVLALGGVNDGLYVDLKNSLKELTPFGELLYLPYGEKNLILSIIKGPDGVFTRAGQRTVIDLNGNEKVLANDVAGNDYQGKFVPETDNSYYDADASIGKVTIDSLRFLNGEEWSVGMTGTLDKTNKGWFLGEFTTMNIGLSNEGKIFFREQSGAYNNFDKLFNEVKNIKTHFSFSCNGTSISLYIDGVFDSLVTPTLTTFFMTKFMKGYIDDENGAFGKMYDGEIWNRELTASEVSGRYNGDAIADKDKGARGQTYLSDFSVDADGLTGVRATLVGNIDGVGGEDDTLKFIVDNTASSTHYFFVFGTKSLVILSKIYRVTGKFYVPNTNADITGFKIGSGNVDIDGSRSYGGFPLSTWNDISYTFKATINNLQFLILGTTDTFSGNGTDIMYFKDLKWVEIGNTLNFAEKKTDTHWFSNGHSIFGVNTGTQLFNSNFGKDVFPLNQYPALILEPQAINIVHDTTDGVASMVKTVTLGQDLTVQCKGTGTYVANGALNGVVSETSPLSGVAITATLTLTAIDVANINWVQILNTLFPLRHIPTTTASVTRPADNVNPIDIVIAKLDFVFTFIQKILNPSTSQNTLNISSETENFNIANNVFDLNPINGDLIYALSNIRNIITVRNNSQEFALFVNGVKVATNAPLITVLDTLELSLSKAASVKYEMFNYDTIILTDAQIINLHSKL